MIGSAGAAPKRLGFMFQAWVVNMYDTPLL